jgi:hypothetical protein
VGFSHSPHEPLPAADLRVMREELESSLNDARSRLRYHGTLVGVRG